MFRIGDEVWTFDYLPGKNKWTPGKAIIDKGTVLGFKDDWVFVDTYIGPAPYKMEDLEYIDAPF